MLTFQTSVFFAETEIYIPLQKSVNLSKKPIEIWEDITQSLYEKRKLYFVPAVSEFLYQDSRWIKKDISLACEFTYGSYQEISASQTVDLYIDHAHIVQFPTESFLMVKFKLPKTLKNFMLAANWLSHIKLNQTSAFLHFPDKSSHYLYDYFNELAEEAGFSLPDNTSKLFTYSLLGVELTEGEYLDKQDPFLLRLKDLLPDEDEELIMTDYDKQAIYQKWKSRISTFSSSGCMTIMTNESEFNLTHYPEYYFNIYRDLALLAYYQIVTLNSFSLQLANVDDLIENRRHIRETRKLILEFTNKAWFSQISLRPNAQILWDYWQRNLQTEKLYNEVSKQLDTLNGYIQQDRAWILTLTGGILTFISWPLTFRKFAGIQSDAFLYGTFAVVSTLLCMVVFDKFRAVVYRGLGNLPSFFKK